MVVLIICVVIFLFFDFVLLNFDRGSVFWGVDGVYGFGSGGPRTRQWHLYPDPGVKRKECERVEDRIDLQ